MKSLFTTRLLVASPLDLKWIGRISLVCLIFCGTLRAQPSVNNGQLNGGSNTFSSSDPNFQGSGNPARVANRPERAPINGQLTGLDENLSVTGAEFEPGQVVANVGGYPIFRADVLADINQLIEAKMGNAPESIKNRQRELALPFAVERAIEQKLLYVDAVRSLPDASKMPEVLGSIRDQFAELRIPEILKSLNVDSPAQAEVRLRQLGTSMRQARDAWVESQFSGFMAREKVNVKPEITHFEMLEYYNKNRKKYFLPAAVRYEQIMVSLDKYPDKEAAWEKLGQLGNEVVYGANFAAVAKKSSNGFAADKGGYHDWTEKGSLKHRKVDEALFTLPVNRLSDRIESEIGFHIVRVLERRDAGYIPFSESQSKIREAILTEKQNEALKKFVEKLKDEIPVERFIAKPEPPK